MMATNLVSIRVVFLMLVSVFLASCSIVQKGGQYYQDDGPPIFKKGPNPDKVADAIPRNEPASRYGNKPYEALGKKFVPMKDGRGFEETGFASWYGRKYHGNRTSNGETYDMYTMTAAHPTLPLPSYVRVRNLANGKAVVVRVNDRGPFLHDRIIDLSYMAARKLDIVGNGTARVHVKTVFANDRTNNSVVTALGSQAVNAPARTAIGEHPFILQAGSFASQANAVNLKSRLADGGYNNVEIQRADVNSKVYYRVRIGPYPDRAAAELIGSTIEEFLGSPVSAIPAGVR